MIALKKSLAMFLAVIMAFTSLSVSAFAVDLSFYTVETYFMNIHGAYSTVPDSTEHSYDVVGSTVVINPSEKEGFTLDNKNSDITVEIKEDGSAVAKVYYQRNRYKLTYVYEDLLGPQTEEASVYFDAELPSFEANPSGKPAKKGYNFIMWSTDPDEKAEAPLKMPASDLDLYPIYEVKTYTYTFDAVDGAFSNGEKILTQEYKYGATVVKPEAPQKDNWVFIDWDDTVPDIAEKDMYFSAMYNEVTYFVAFFDGEEEIYFEDGYFAGDYFEKVDVPEGYEAWTLFDGTYVTFPYKIEGDTTFYSAPAPEEYTARFYLDIEDDVPYATYKSFSGSAIKFPEEPSRIGYKFISWTSDISVMPDEDIDFIAEWEPIEYTITFDTDGGSAIDPAIYCYENEVAVPEMPQRDGYVFLGWEPEIPEKMPAEDITVTAQWEKTVKDDYLGIKTVLYTYDETLGDWVPADKVERGEKVKARVFLETGFAVSDGQLLFFINNDAFTCDYVGTPDIELNSSSTSTAGKYYINGNYAAPSKNHHTFTELVEEGYITKEFLENHTPITMSFYFADFIFRKISGEEWFAEFEITAKDDAVGMGDFFVVPETIQSEDRYFAYIGFSRGVEGDSMLSSDYDSMFDWTASINVESNPVSTGYGRITVDAGEGYFISTDKNVMSFESFVGAPVTIENPVREGYLFAGYEPEIPEVMTDDIINAKAVWEACDDISYTVIAHYTDFSSGEAVENTAEYKYAGVTETVVKIVEEMPVYPDENTTYILLESFEFEYNVFDYSAANIFETVIIPDGSGIIELYFKPATYNVIFNANGGKFDDGTSVKSVEASHGTLAIDIVPAGKLYKYGFTFSRWSNLDETTGIEGEVVFNAEWQINVHTLTLIVDGNEYKEDYEFGSIINSEVVPEKIGHNFVRWEDENGIEYAYIPEVMPDESITLTAIFEKNQYAVSFDDGTNVTEEIYFYDDEIIAPANPVREGYTFVGWADENGEIVRDFGKVPAENVEFKAKWVPHKHSAVFNANEGEFADGSKEFIIVYEYDECIFEPAEQPVRDGYVFCGWQDEDGNDLSNDGYVIKNDVVFTAKWEINFEYELDENGNAVITGLSSNAFKDLVIPSTIGGHTVTEIKDGAFKNNSDLTSVVIPESVTNIGDEAFADCDNLTDIIVDEDNPAYSSDENGVLFNKDKTEFVQYPAGKTDKDYVVPDGVTKIESGAFSGCENLENITVPDSVTSVGDKAFNDCTGLKNIYFSGSKTDWDSAFEGSADEQLKDTTVYYTEGYYTYTVDSEGNATITDVYEGIMGEVTVPSELGGHPVTTIGSLAFSDCDSLVKVVISGNVTTIGWSAFVACDSLRTVVIGDSVKIVDDGAFDSCRRLSSVEIGENVEYIGQYSFADNTSLTDIVIPDSVKTIGWNAFENCSSLKTVKIGEGVTKIDRYAFKECNSLETVYIGSSIEYIGQNAFYPCKVLDDVQYNGTKDSWSNVTVKDGNGRLTVYLKYLKEVETTTKPVVTEPTTAKPTTTKPVVTEPTTAKPTTTKPVVTEPTTAKPTTTKPVVTEPTTAKPTTTKPVVTEPTTAKPTTTKPVVTEPTTAKPTTTKPVVTEPTTAKPTTTKPVVTEPTTTKPVEVPTTTKPVEVPTTTKPVEVPTTTKPVEVPTTTKPVEVPTTTKPVEVPTTKPVTKPTEPTTKPSTQPGNVEFEIRQPSVTTIKYGDSIILHADIKGTLPQGAKIEWSIDNENFKLVSTSADGTRCTITPNANGNSVITATILDKDGKEIGSDTQSMTSKAGFFQKIIAFFKKLFGMTKIIPEIFRPVFEK